MKKQNIIRKFAIILLSLSAFSLSFISTLVFGQVMLQRSQIRPDEYISEGTLLLAVIVSSFVMFIIFKLLLFLDDRLFCELEIEQ